jgi:hypothetical protein
MADAVATRYQIHGIHVRKALRTGGIASRTVAGGEGGGSLQHLSTGIHGTHCDVSTWIFNDSYGLTLLRMRHL